MVLHKVKQCDLLGACIGWWPACLFLSLLKVWNSTVCF